MHKDPSAIDHLAGTRCLWSLALQQRSRWIKGHSRSAGQTIEHLAPNRIILEQSRHQPCLTDTAIATRISLGRTGGDEENLSQAVPRSNARAHTERAVAHISAEGPVVSEHRVRPTSSSSSPNRLRLPRGGTVFLDRGSEEKMEAVATLEASEKLDREVSPHPPIDPATGQGRSAAGLPMECRGTVAGRNLTIPSSKSSTVRDEQAGRFSVAVLPQRNSPHQPRHADASIGLSGWGGRCIWPNTLNPGTDRCGGVAPLPALSRDVLRSPR